MSGQTIEGQAGLSRATQRLKKPHLGNSS